MLEAYKNISENVTISGDNIVPYIMDMFKFMESKGLEVKPFPKVTFSKEKKYANDLFGKTAYYDPNLKEIVLYTEGRHIRDVLRSAFHEAIHHVQNMRGDLEDTSEGLTDPNYAQNDKKLRKMEEEAYLKGNMLMRDWSDNIKVK